MKLRNGPTWYATAVIVAFIAVLIWIGYCAWNAP